ncbi:hypothetical protein EDB84DRAFT_1572591 [Lactarius hengduanensis]|nr:hypothetical protein EDB84DRAFT_1572591 [Lactarius hengduanensis]
MGVGRPTPPSSPLLSPPLLPLPSPTPLASKGGRSAAGPFACARREEAHGSMPPPVRAALFAAHEDKERTGFPRVCATPFAWKGAHNAHRRPAPPFSPSPRVRTEWGRTRAHGPSLPIRAEAVRTRPHRLPVPSPFPLVHATPVHAERGVRGQRPIPWRPVRAGRSAREGAHEAKPSPPPRRTAGPPQRKGKPAPHLQPAPVAPPSSRAPPPPSFAQTGTQEGHAPAPPCPRTQGEGRRAHLVPSAQATLAPPHAHHTAPPVHARGGVGVQPLRTGHSGPVFTRPAIPADTGGSVRPAQPLPRRVHLPVYAREEARVRGLHPSTHAREGSQNEGRYNPGG